MRREYTQETTKDWYITDGLQLHLDGILNTRSGHQSAPNAWEDLTTNHYDFVKAVGTSQFNNKYCILDGATMFECTNSGLGTRDASSDIKSITKGTLEVVFKNNDNVINVYFMQPSNGAGFCSKAVWWRPSSATYVMSASAADGRWPHKGSVISSYSTSINSISVDYDNSIFMLNNIVQSNAGTNGSFSSLYSSIGARRNETQQIAYYGKFNLYAVRLYNRALTAEEKTHNYNLDKIRFEF